MPRHATKTSFVKDHPINKGCFIKGDPRIKEFISNRRSYSGENNPNYKGGKVIKYCVVCGKEYERKKNEESETKTCSIKCLGVWHSLEMRNEKASNWKGGITSIHQLIKNSKEYKEWREAVFKRDNFTCQKCEANNVYINAHHIKSFSNFPELRFEINNGVTLCEPCHSLTENFKGRVRNEERLQCRLT